MNVSGVLSLAKRLNGYGFNKLADKLVVRNFGSQIGRTSKAGIRCFSGRYVPQPICNLGSRAVSDIDKVLPEKVITAIDKDYNIIGQTVIRRKYSKPDDMKNCYTQIERLLMPKADDAANTCCFDVTGFFGEHVTSKPGERVFRDIYRSRKALAPESIYHDGRLYGIRDAGSTIYDSFHYSYTPLDKQGNVVCSVSNIEYANGGETFVNKVKQMVKEWFEKDKVVIKNSI